MATSFLIFVASFSAADALDVDVAFDANTPVVLVHVLRMPVYNNTPRAQDMRARPRASFDVVHIPESSADRLILLFRPSLDLFLFLDRFLGLLELDMIQCQDHACFYTKSRPDLNCTAKQLLMRFIWN